MCVSAVGSRRTNWFIGEKHIKMQHDCGRENKNSAAVKYIFFCKLVTFPVAFLQGRGI